MATNIKGTTIASSYDRIVLVDDDGADIGSGTTTKNIEIQTSGGSSFGEATATSVHLSTNRVGIGTAAPLSPFHIESTVDEKLRLSYDANDYMTIATGSSGQTTITTVSNATAGHIILAPDGNVGIGTSSPDFELEVESSESSGTTELAITNSNQPSEGETGQATALVFNLKQNDGDVVKAGMIKVGKSDDWTPDGNSDSFIDFYTTDAGTNAFAMRIDKAGKVGIGTTPLSRFHVESTVDEKLRLSYDAGDYMTIATGSDGQTTITTVDSDGAAGHIALMPDGNVGIGALAPNELLHISGATDAQPMLLMSAHGSDADSDFPMLRFIRSKGSTGSPSIIADNDYLGGVEFGGFLGSSGGDYYTNYDTGAAIYGVVDGTPGNSNEEIPTELQFWTSPVGTDGMEQRMCIRKNGDVGIGVASPTSTRVLHVKSTIAGTTGRIENSHGSTPYGPEIMFSGAAPNNATQYFLVCSDNAPSNRFVLYSNGQINAPVHYSTSAGSTQTALFVDNTGMFGKVSSIRDHKKNIVDMEDISWIYNLKPRNFEYKVMETEEYEDDNKIKQTRRTGKYLDKADGIKQYGLIAEEVKEVSGAESILEYDNDGKLNGVSYHKFASILLKAIQELSAKVTSLESASNDS